MAGLLARVGTWWGGGETKAQSGPFQLTCPCGQMLTGHRHARHQVIRCPGCGQDRFVLPASPWLAPLQKTRESNGLKLHHWLWPLAGAAVTAGALLALFLVFLAPRPLVPPKDETKNPASPDPGLQKSRLAAARKLMGEGSFRLAAQELATNPVIQGLSDEEQRTWKQLEREAALLADLVAEPLEEIVRHAPRVGEQEWQADFPHRYQGKSLILDLEARRLPRGRVIHNFPLRVGNEEARLDLDDLQLLKPLALEMPQRLVFGARLGSVRLELPGPTWVVRFLPDSGVWLTDPAAAERSCPPLGEEEGRKVLARQASWVGKE